MLLVYFNLIDVYHLHFFSTGLVVISYHCARLFFIFSLMMLFFAVGDRALLYVGKDKYNVTLSLNTFLLAFFSGVGICQAILLFMGFAGLFDRALLAGLTVIIFALSLPRLDRLFRQGISFLPQAYWPGIILVALPTSLFLVTKGLYPAGGHDYYNHYFQFYRTVTESGIIRPNQVWYHFLMPKVQAFTFWQCC